jgi:hypothetical protein
MRKETTMYRILQEASPSGKASTSQNLAYDIILSLIDSKKKVNLGEVLYYFEPKDLEAIYLLKRTGEIETTFNAVNKWGLRL